MLGDRFSNREDYEIKEIITRKSIDKYGHSANKYVQMRTRIDWKESVKVDWEVLYQKNIREWSYFTLYSMTGKTNFLLFLTEFVNFKEYFIKY